MYGQGDFVIHDDDLEDYNDPEDPKPEQSSSHSPTHTPRRLDSESEGEDEAKREAEAKRDEAQRDLEEGLKAEEDIGAAELARRAKRIQEFETLSLRLTAR